MEIDTPISEERHQEKNEKKTPKSDVIETAFHTIQISRRNPSSTQHSVLAEPQAHNRLFARITRSSRIPADFFDGFLQQILAGTIDFQPLVPLAATGTLDLKHLVLLAHWVRTAEAFEQFFERRVAWDMDSFERELRRRRQLPRWNVGAENVGLGVLGSKEQIVARLAAYTSCGIGHLGGGHRGIDRGPRLGLAWEHVSRPVGLVRECLLGVIAAGRALRGKGRGHGNPSWRSSWGSGVS